MYMIKTILILTLTLSAFAQEPATKVRVYIADSQSWAMAGGFSDSSGGFSGGARPQTAEIIKTFEKKCEGFTVTARKDRADYVLVVDHEGGKALLLKDTKFVVYDKEGDSIKSGSARTVGSAVKDSCEAIKKAVADKL
jgi:hypothetical protein